MKTSACQARIFTHIFSRLFFISIFFFCVTASIPSYFHGKFLEKMRSV